MMMMRTLPLVLQPRWMMCSGLPRPDDHHTAPPLHPSHELHAYHNWTNEKGFQRIDATGLAALMRGKGFEKKVAKIPGHEKQKNALKLNRQKKCYYYLLNRSNRSNSF